MTGIFAGGFGKNGVQNVVFRWRICGGLLVKADKLTVIFQARKFSTFPKFIFSRGLLLDQAVVLPSLSLAFLAVCGDSGPP